MAAPGDAGHSGAGRHGADGRRGHDDAGSGLRGRPGGRLDRQRAQHRGDLVLHRHPAGDRSDGGAGFRGRRPSADQQGALPGPGDGGSAGGTRHPDRARAGSRAAAHWPTGGDHPASVGLPSGHRPRRRRLPALHVSAADPSGDEHRAAGPDRNRRRQCVQRVCELGADLRQPGIPGARRAGLGLRHFGIPLGDADRRRGVRMASPAPLPWWMAMVLVACDRAASLPDRGGADRDSGVARGHRVQLRRRAHRPSGRGGAQRPSGGDQSRLDLLHGAPWLRRCGDYAGRQRDRAS